MTGERWWPARPTWCAVGGLALLGAAIALYERLVRPWHLRWGASDDEVEARLVGDDLVAEPARQCTRAITIAAPPDRVWPWVVQLGADRGGFYSYDWLENLFALGIHSADRIVPEWQRREVGDLVYADATGSGGWYVMAVEPDRVLVLQVADVEAGHPVRRTEPPWWEFAWTFALRRGPDGTTRLLVRERVAFGKLPVRLAMAPVGVVSFVMTRKMMLGITARAERAATAH
jgi:hypothetical protein